MEHVYEKTTLRCGLCGESGRYTTPESEIELRLLVASLWQCKGCGAMGTKLCYDTKTSRI